MDHPIFWQGKTFSKFRNESYLEPQPIKVIKNGQVKIVPADHFEKPEFGICACGCGQSFFKNNGTRKYVEGHQP